MRETLLHSLHRCADGARARAAGSTTSGVAGQWAWQLDTADQALSLCRLGSSVAASTRLPAEPVAPAAVAACVGSEGAVVFVGVAGGVARVDVRETGEIGVVFARTRGVGAVVCVAVLEGLDGGGGVAVGFECGSVARVVFGAGAEGDVDFDLFGGGDADLFGAEAPEPVPINADNTSVVSVETHDDGSRDGGAAIGAESHASSYRSAASTISRGLIGRFFGRGADDGEGAVGGSSSMAYGLTSGGYAGDGSGTADRRPVYGFADGDPVRAIAVSQLSVPVVVSLHASGRVCVFAPTARHGYRLAGEIRLEVKLASSPAALQFLLSSGDGAGSLLAVTTVDCEPLPHALRVFSLALSMGITRRVSVVATPVLQREGPFDRVAGAAVLPAVGAVPLTLLLAPESGQLAAFHLPAVGEAPEVGLGTDAIWSALDDLTSPFGMWAAFDAMRLGLAERLLAVGRFSPLAVAKALRVPDLAGASFGDVADVAQKLVMDALSEGEDETTTVDRILQRSQRAAIISDMPVTRLEVLPSIGVVVSRLSGIHVLRPLLDAEALWFGRTNAISEAFSSPVAPESTSMLNNRSDYVTRLLSAHAAPQLAAANFLLSEIDSVDRSRAACVLSVGLRVSIFDGDKMSISEHVAQSLSAAWASVDAKPLVLAEQVARVSDTLIPGRSLLSFLHNAKQFGALQDAASRCSDLLPVSSLFCLGLIFVEESKRLGGDDVEFSEEAHDQGRDTEMDDGIVDGEKPRQQNSPSIDAFSSFVTASKTARSLLADGAVDGRQVDFRQDLRCAVDLAELKGLGLVQDRAAEKDAMLDAGDTEEDLEIAELTRHLDFWLLERALRLVEASGSSKTAAAIALEALAAAPDAKKYEMMRAAAFGRFLDAGDLECALQTILKEPFQVSGSQVAEAVNEESACALRDSIALLVNASIDAGRFTWLLKGDLPAPVKELSALALERRARSSEMFVRDQILREGAGALDDGRPSSGQSRISSAYEYLYVWQLRRHDMEGAASCAVEWFERVATEGLSETRMFASSGPSLTHSPLTLLLTWARVKMRALAAACAAVRTLPPKRQYVARSRHSVLAGYTPADAASGVVDLDWLSRRLLLARAQMVCLTKRLSGSVQSSSPKAKMPSSEYVVSQADILLGDQERGVNFAVSSLLSGSISTENVFLALDLALAWDLHVPEVVRVAGVLCSAGSSSGGDQRRTSSLSYADLSKLLETVSRRSRKGGRYTSRNWYIVAAEGALEASAGTIGLPKWLSDAAAFGPGVGAEAQTFASGKVGGDARGMVNVWLRYGRLVEAAQLLIAGLRETMEYLERMNDGKPADESVRACSSTLSDRIDVPYSQIDATLELLAASIEEGGRGVFQRRKYRDELQDLSEVLAGTYQ